MTIAHFKLGRKPRLRNPRVPHYSAIAAGAVAPPVPAGVDWAAGVPADGFGTMLNDRLGDCTCAGFYHARQVWTFNAAGKIDTEPDANVGLLYQRACGWNPADPSTDQGGAEQDVLSYLMKVGAPIGAGGESADRIAGFYELDSKKVDDVKRAIYDCGVAYIGFDVPAYMPEQSGAVWDLGGGDPTIVGGHCVVLCGYDSAGATAISWGSKYRMTWRFFLQFCDEAYGVIDQSWVAATGRTPAGMSEEQTEEQMSALRAAA
jgi:hypothetical protein